MLLHPQIYNMASVIGNVGMPEPVERFGDVEGGLGSFLNLIMQTLIIGGGIYALFNFILAGYAFLEAGDDSKKIQGAWARIYQSVIGLLFMAGSFVLAAIFGKLIFGSYDAILSPSIPEVGS